MIAAMSHWSRPSRGQTMPLMELCLWALAAKFARQQFGKLVLYTDSNGAKLLVDILGIQVDELHLDLEHFAPPLQGAWSLGKIETYRLLAERGEPFCHVDGDVVLLKRPPQQLLAAPIFCQFSERHLHDVYPLHIIQPQFPKLDPTLESHMTRRMQNAYNLGIVGGTDYDFFREYARGVLTAAHDFENLRASRLSDNTLTLFLEQYTFGAYAESKSVATLLPAPLQHDSAILAREMLPQLTELGFVHFWGNSKRDPRHFDRILNRAELELPGVTLRAQSACQQLKHTI